ncbi:iron-containing redox enzyme family protein [Candidatus Peregrinibacteria bacterium]|nr:MAG: iron-containing redox enzyme family protein [Candidatus Peregrinibacteria bacterium]
MENRIKQHISQAPDQLTPMLNRIDSNEALMEFLARYVAFNKVFGPCVSILAGRIGLNPLFGSSIASPVFYAAIDEFGGAGKTDHSTLADAMLRTASKFLGLTLTDGNDHPPTRTAISQVISGYTADQAGGASRDDLLKAIGFHNGSEAMADREFNTLNNYLNQQHPALIAALEEGEGGRWIKIHNTVEEKHAEQAVRAANLACNALPPEQRKMQRHWC